jgi:hypothetical protein
MPAKFLSHYSYIICFYTLTKFVDVIQSVTNNLPAQYKEKETVLKTLTVLT